MRIARLIVGFTCVASAAGALLALAQTPAPIDWIYVVDTSIAMAGNGRAGRRDIFADVKRDMRELLARSVQTGDTVRLITFSSDVAVGDQLAVADNAAKEVVRARIDALEAAGSHTNLAKAIDQTTDVVISQRAAGRSSVAVIFTDGIDDPAPGTAHLGLKDTLARFLQTNVLLYFVNPRASDANAGSNQNELSDAYAALGLQRWIRARTDALPLPTAASPQMEPLLVTVRPKDAPTLQPNHRFDWSPFDVSTNRPVAIAIDAFAPAGVTIDPIPALPPGASTVHVQGAAPRDADGDVYVRFTLRPLEAGAPTVETTARLHIHAPTTAERIVEWMWPASGMLLAVVAAAAAYWHWRSRQ